MTGPPLNSTYWDDSRLSSLLDSLPAGQAETLLADLRTVLPWSPHRGPQSQAYLSQADELYYGGAAGGGKALALETPIPTPAGWTTMGELRDGDTVFGKDGTPARVVTAHSVLYDRPCYEVEFDTGDRIVCDEEHLWHTYTAKDLVGLTRRDPEWRARRRLTRASRATGLRSTTFTAAITARNKTRPPLANPAPVGAVRTTAEIAATLTVGANGRRNHAVEVAGAIDTPAIEVDLDPYLLGLWLGDGSSSQGQFTTDDAELIAAWRAGGFETVKYAAPFSNGIYKLKVILRRLGVLGDKHVPPAYLRGSRSQRMALLQGLMDTDGHAAADGSVEFDNTNRRLAESVYELAVGLGEKPSWIEGRAKLQGRDCGPKYRVVWHPAEPVFRLPRKAARHREGNRRRTARFRYVVSVRPVASVPVRCITVDAPDRLYLCGRGMIPTHNTQLAIGLALTQHRNSLILRRQSVDTKGIVEAIRAIPNAGKWRSSGYGGELRTPDGRLIEVGGCQWEEDWQKYAGQPHDFIDLDELPQFSRRQYAMLCAWNRVAQPALYPHQRCRVVGGGNPPLSPEGEWVLKRWGAWLDQTRGALVTPGELRWYVSIGDEDREVPDNSPVIVKGKPVKPRSRTFIPARLEDNPGLLHTGYDATLDALPEPIRSALRHGDMTAGRQDDRWQLIPTRWVVESQKRWVERAKNLGPLSAVGVDVGMSPSDGDQTVLAPRHGATVATLIRRPSRETPDGQSVVNLLIAAQVGRVPVNIDAIGIGKSAYDAAVMMNVAYPVPVIVSEGTDWTDPKIPGMRFANLRAAMMWNVRVLLDPEGGEEASRLALPPDAELLTDLTAARYKLQLSGVAVESKDDIRKRIGRSTDAGDAVALACWQGGSTPESYSKPKPRDPGRDRLTGLPKGIFG